MTIATAAKTRLGRPGRAAKEAPGTPAPQGALSEVKTAVRTLKIFELFAARKRQLVLAELAEQLEIPASSCLLLVRTLLERGYLYETARRGGYYPTRRLFEYASQIVAHDPVTERVRPVLERLRDVTGETTTLSKVQGTRLIYLLVLDSRHIVRPAMSVGTLRPLHSTATGKALLSTMDKAARAELLREAGMPRLTSTTVVSLGKLEAEIQGGLDRGWFSNDGQSVPDLSGIAVAVQFSGEAYAVSVMGPTHRVSSSTKACAEALLEAKATIERKLPQ